MNSKTTLCDKRCAFTGEKWLLGHKTLLNDGDYAVVIRRIQFTHPEMESYKLLQESYIG